MHDFLGTFAQELGGGGLGAAFAFGGGGWGGCCCCAGGGKEEEEKGGKEEETGGGGRGGRGGGRHDEVASLLCWAFGSSCVRGLEGWAGMGGWVAVLWAALMTNAVV